MSLTRAIPFSRPRPSPLILYRRSASMNSRPAVQEYHNEPSHEEDSTQFPKETFGNVTWRNGIILVLFGVGCYKFAPVPSDETYLTRVVASFSPSAQRWTDINLRHTLLTHDASEGTILVADAKKPRTHRYRYPETFDRVQPHLQPVGPSVDLSGVIVKNDKE